ncbi:MAG: hypothetical protein P4L53_03820 [Candidatus Obscuribacterales bacterium]|nr:hypothetical protein [Candidatus Obscuribacterales bacterium]
MNNSRLKLQEVMQRAALLDLSDLAETDLLRGIGMRDSPSRSYSALGQMESIVEWTPDYPYSAINWGLSSQTSPRKKLVIKRRRLLKRDWCIIVDSGPTMNFGTEHDFKKVVASQLSATMALTAEKKKDRIKHIVYDSVSTGIILEDATAEEMILSVLQHSPYSAMNDMFQSSPNQVGLAGALCQGPDNASIMPVISDFLNLTEADRKALLSASRYHKVLACVVEDPREVGFPSQSGQLTIRDILTGNERTMTFAEANALISKDRDERLLALNAFFRSAHIPYQIFQSGETVPVTRSKLVKLLRGHA